MIEGTGGSLFPTFPEGADFRIRPLPYFPFLPHQPDRHFFSFKHRGAGGCHGGSRRRENVSVLRLLKPERPGSGNVFQLLLWEPPVAPPRTLVRERGLPGARIAAFSGHPAVAAQRPQSHLSERPRARVMTLQRSETLQGRKNASEREGSLAPSGLVLSPHRSFRESPWQPPRPGRICQPWGLIQESRCFRRGCGASAPAGGDSGRPGPRGRARRTSGRSGGSG